ncbi:zinc finger, GRF-type [Artemisia annua]|uniref:Zinc finger, GRF-type n=1 Tax=Artemisia annua TaxID=35608 RepID=A0A2U1LHN9_ARTAN|nr:zinc finger, GRF-type [Artemisia annua]
MVFCHCGKRAVVRTSWTPTNPGRRFYACPDRNSDCRFIDFMDPPMCQRSVQIIPGLLRNINNLQANLSQVQDDHARVKKYLIRTWIEICLFVLFKIIT